MSTRPNYENAARCLTLGAATGLVAGLLDQYLVRPLEEQMKTVPHTKDYRRGYKDGYNLGFNEGCSARSIGREHAERAVKDYLLDAPNILTRLFDRLHQDTGDLLTELRKYPSVGRRVREWFRGLLLKPRPRL